MIEHLKLLLYNIDIIIQWEKCVYRRLVSKSKYLRNVITFIK